MKILILLFMVISAFIAKNAARAEGAKPEEAGAPIKGYTVSHVEAGSPLDKLGLKDGDVLKSVNGQAISSKEDVDKLPDMLKNSKRVRIEVTRDGKTEIFHRSNLEKK